MPGSLDGVLIDDSACAAPCAIANNKNAAVVLDLIEFKRKSLGIAETKENFQSFARLSGSGKSADFKFLAIS